MKISVIGTGYVSLVSSVCFVQMGNIVSSFDKSVGMRYNKING